MAIFVNENTKVIVQGLTGGQGRFHGLRNRAYGTKVVGGVTPGKAGQDVEGIPVFDTVEDAVRATGATASFIAVPPKAAPAAILEAARAGIEFIVDREGNAFTYDVNTNTNYNPEAEARAGVSGMGAIADHLTARLDWVDPSPLWLSAIGAPH